MMKSMFLSALILVVVAPFIISSVDAFTPTFQAARIVPGVKAAHMRQAILMHMSEEEKTTETETEETAVAPAKGEAFYDDEVRIQRYYFSRTCNTLLPLTVLIILSHTLLAILFYSFLFFDVS